jgi:aminocarboxymuconate-semialdehyde decarboxylase
MTDAAQRLRDMDEMGVDIQVLATFVSQFYYWTDGDLGQRIARLQNDRLAEMVARHPDRFVAVGTVPLQDCARAVAELEHVMGTPGFKGCRSRAASTAWIWTIHGSCRSSSGRSSSARWC